MANPFTPQAGDAAVEMLKLVFGPVMDAIVPGIQQTATTPSSGMLAEAFRMFNSGVLMFGSLIVTYVTMMGIVNTANDGEALGKRWSTFYTPLRTFSAAAALIPGSSGYAAIQVMMLIIVSYSIGFASTMWKGLNEYMLGTNVANEAVKSIVKDPGFDSIAVNAMRMTLCAKGINAAMAAVSPDSQVNLQYVKYDAAPDKSSAGAQINKTTFAFSDPKWPNSESLCGQIVMRSTYMAPPRGGSKLANDVAPSIKEAIYQVRARYVESFFTGDFAQQADRLAQAAVTDGATFSSQNFAKLIDDMKDRQMADIVSAVSNAISQGENGGTLSSLTDKGWVYAGSMYREMGRLKDAVRNTTTSSSDFISGSDSPLEKVLTGDTLIAANSVLTQYNAIAAELSHRVFQMASQSTSSEPVVPKLKTSFTIADMTDGEGVKGQINGFFNRISNSILSGAVYYLEDPDADPVMKIKNLGDWMATVAEAILLSKVLIVSSLTALKATALSSMIPGSSLAGGPIALVLQYIIEMWSAFGPSIMALMYLGYYLGIWIPMVPFFMFATGVVGWLVFVVEMMAAGMLWAAAHTTPAREDSFIGSQTQGYMLLMSGFFRPALMVIGLVASNALLYPVTSYLNEAFLSSFRSLQADSVTGLFSLAGYMLIYCIAITACYMLLFALPQALPDNILRWIGAGVGDLGEKGMASKLEGSASTQARQAAVWGSAGGQKFSGIQGEKRNKADRDKAAAAQEKATNARHDALMGALGQSRSDPVGETGQSTVGTFSADD
jgi:conjugal transfer/type IV secretion protein DotA/TraY